MELCHRSQEGESVAVDWGIIGLRWTSEARKLPESGENPRMTPSPGRHREDEVRQVR